MYMINTAAGSRSVFLLSTLYYTACNEYKISLSLATAV